MSVAELKETPQLELRIHLERGQKVMLDADLAQAYGVSTKVLNQAVKRNLGRFPSDFVFRLTVEEYDATRSQIVTSNNTRGGRRYLPFVFTEHGGRNAGERIEQFGGVSGQRIRGPCVRHIARSAVLAQ